MTSHQNRREILVPAGLGRARLRNLEELTAHIPCYEMGITASLERGQAVSTLLSLCDGSRDQSRSASSLGRRR